MKKGYEVFSFGFVMGAGQAVHGTAESSTGVASRVERVWCCLRSGLTRPCDGSF